MFLLGLFDELGLEYSRLVVAWSLFGLVASRCMYGRQDLLANAEIFIVYLSERPSTRGCFFQHIHLSNFSLDCYYPGILYAPKILLGFTTSPCNASR